MDQVLLPAEDDVRLELGIPLGTLWCGIPWKSEERRCYIEEKDWKDSRKQSKYAHNRYYGA